MAHPKKCSCLICQKRRERQREKRERLKELSEELAAADQVREERAAIPQQAPVTDQQAAIAAILKGAAAAPAADQPAAAPAADQPAAAPARDLSEIIKIKMGMPPAPISEDQLKEVVAKAEELKAQPEQKSSGAITFDQTTFTANVTGLMLSGVIDVPLLLIAYFLFHIKTQYLDLIMLDKDEVAKVGEVSTPFIEEKLKDSPNKNLYAMLLGLSGILTKKTMVMLEVVKLQEEDQKAEIAALKAEVEQIKQQQQPQKT
jgi:hypothetical protein